GRVRARRAPGPGVSGSGLGPLDVAGVAAILAERYGDPPHELLAAWLHEETEGNPLFLTQYLARLEEQGVLRRDDDRWTLDGTISGRPGAWTLDGALAAAETPESLLTLLAPRVEVLEDEERSLLESGAVQGRRFLST